MAVDYQRSAKLYGNEERERLLPVRVWEECHGGDSGRRGNWGWERVVLGEGSLSRNAEDSKDSIYTDLAEVWGPGGSWKWHWMKDQSRFLGSWVPSEGARAPFPRAEAVQPDRYCHFQGHDQNEVLRVHFEGRWRKDGEIEEAVLIVQEKIHWGLFFPLPSKAKWLIKWGNMYLEIVLSLETQRMVDLFSLSCSKVYSVSLGDLDPETLPSQYSLL